MQEEGVHMEFSISGISREIFRSLLEWMWELVEPAFPIITGAWGVEQTVYFSGAIAGLALLARLIRYLNEDETSNERIPDSFGGKAVGIHAQSLEPSQKKGMGIEHPRTGAATATNTSEVSKVVSLVLFFTHRSLGFISRMGLNYLLLSLLICVFFGTGDLQLLPVLGIGG